jgi:hypothetical protein
MVWRAGIRGTRNESVGYCIGRTCRDGVGSGESNEIRNPWNGSISRSDRNQLIAVIKPMIRNNDRAALSLKTKD